LLAFAEREISETKNISELYTGGCDMLVGVGGYMMAWAGLAEHDDRKSVLPVAHSGYNSHYVESLRFSWADDETGLSAPGTTIREGVVQVIDSIQAATHVGVWRKRALDRGYAAVAAFPLRDQREVFGMLCVYAREEGKFIHDEVQTLTLLADRLSAGVQGLRLLSLRKLTAHG
jgi:GAF domain-containing protein